MSRLDQMVFSFFLVLTEFTRKKLKLKRSFSQFAYTFSQFFISYLSYNLCKDVSFFEKRSIIPGYQASSFPGWSKEKSQQFIINYPECSPATYFIYIYIFFQPNFSQVFDLSQGIEYQIMNYITNYKCFGAEQPRSKFFISFFMFSLSSSKKKLKSKACKQKVFALSSAGAGRRSVRFFNIHQRIARLDVIYAK